MSGSGFRIFCPEMIENVQLGIYRLLLHPFQRVVYLLQQYTNHLPAVLCGANRTGQISFHP